MRLLLIHQYFLEEEDAGASRWNEMTRMWTEKGHSITVLGGMMHANGSEKRPEYKGAYFRRKMQGEVEVIRCHVSESYNKGFAGRLWGYFSFMISVLWGGLFMVKGKYDLVIVTSPPLFVGFSGYLISRLRRMSLVFEIRDLWPESAIDTGILRNKVIIKLAYWFEGFIYRKAKLINVLTPAFYDALRDIKKVPESKLVMIPNAADFSLTEPLLRDFDRNAFRREHDLEDYFVITYVGAHGVANHLEQILEAGSYLQDTNVLFLLIGQGMEKRKLQQIAIENNIKNVRFIDAVPKKDVFKYILASEMGASVLKKADTFKTVYSNKSFDYMACKKPILMAIDGVSRKLVEDAGCGTYIEPENIASYNSVIRGYINNTNRLTDEGINGYKYAMLHFDRSILADRFIKHIERILN